MASVTIAWRGKRGELGPEENDWKFLLCLFNQFKVLRELLVGYKFEIIPSVSRVKVLIVAGGLWNRTNKAYSLPL